MFKNGDSSFVQYITSSNGNYTINAEVFDGGALYESVLQAEQSESFYFYKSGSGINAYPPTYLAGIIFDAPYFQTGSNNILTSSAGTSIGWTGSNPFNWLLYLLNPGFKYSTDIAPEELNIFKKDGINFNNNLMPVQPLDFIRIPSNSLFNSNSNEKRILGFTIDPLTPNNVYVSLDSSLSGSSALSNANQRFIIYRRTSNNFVITKTQIPSGTGLLIPKNYNPKLNYLEIAKKAGLL